MKIKINHINDNPTHNNVSNLEMTDTKIYNGIFIEVTKEEKTHVNDQKLLTDNNIIIEDSGRK